MAGELITHNLLIAGLHGVSPHRTPETRIVPIAAFILSSSPGITSLRAAFLDLMKKKLRFSRVLIRSLMATEVPDRFQFGAALRMLA